LTQTFGDTTIYVFDKVIVQMSIEKKTIQSSEMQLKLVRPKVRKVYLVLRFAEKHLNNDKY